MNRAVVVVFVAAMLLIAGCGETATNNGAPEDDVANDVTDPNTGDATDADSDSDGNETSDADTTDADDDPPLGNDSAAKDANQGTETPESASDMEGELEIHHIDVGQADATLLIEPGGETMLIDTGDWRQDGEGVLDYLEAHDIDRIDHLVATHAHADHIGGHSAIIEHYEIEREGIGAAYDSGIATTSQTYEGYLDSIEDHDVDLFVVEEGDSLEFGAAQIHFFNPPADDSDDDIHYNSITLTVEFGEFTYLATGDAEADAEERMVKEYDDELTAETYQAGHHGSSTSSTAPFMDHANPETTIISSASDSQYDHPSDEVLEDFADRDIETYWTAVHGDIILTTDGTEYGVETEHEFSTDPDDLLEEKSADDTQDSFTLPTQSAVAPLAG